MAVFASLRTGFELYAGLKNDKKTHKFRFFGFQYKLALMAGANGGVSPAYLRGTSNSRIVLCLLTAVPFL